MKKFKILVLVFLTTVSLIAQTGQELYRPAFHYSPRNNWMNDPNGLVYYKKKYHLFYQYNPLGIQPANISWGHAVSTDLIHWEEKPVAIPVQNGVMAYSGSVVVDWNNTSGFGINGDPPLIAIYTGATNVQDQRIAYSTDEGLTWTNYAQNPVLTMNNNQFRDPKVIWHKESNQWIMVVSLGAFQGIRFYTSPDLKNWTYMPGFSGYGNLSGLWECPDFFPLNSDNDSTSQKWILAHSVGPTAQYFIGDFDGRQFEWENILPTGILIDDFESENYNNWITSGTSFGTAPIRGNGTYSGYLGDKLISSQIGGSGSEGKLVSRNFTIQKKYISFLIGGGHYPKNTYIKLVVNGDVIRTSTGGNENLMKWRNWDVSPYIGKTARIEIVDSIAGAWGYINVDHIIQSDAIVDNINSGQVDYGKDFYALQSFSDVPDGKRIWLAWLNSWNYALSVPTSPWKGIMSIPREVKLETHNGQLKLVQKPIEQLSTLRKSGISFNNKKITAINNSLNNHAINNVQNNPVFKKFELKVRVNVHNKIGFSLKFKKQGTQYSEFVFDFINKEIRFDRSKSGGLIVGDQYFRELQVAPLLTENDSFDLHLFVDNCSAELFTAGGQVVMSNQIFPDSTSNSIELTSLGEDYTLDEFNIWSFENNSLSFTPILPEISQLFEIFPNPVSNGDALIIKIKDDMVGKIKFSLFDVNGRLVSEFQPTTNSVTIPRDILTKGKGLFFLRGSTGQFTRIEKILAL